MECIIGFSNTFMPENKIEAVDLPLQYIEGGELEKAWKHTRRQRLKEQEQKIWEEFTKEKDILSSVLNDDPYQFIEDLPEIHVQELIEQAREAKKQKAELLKDEADKEEDHCEDRKSPSPDRLQGITFTSLREDESGIFHIYSDDKDSDPDDKEEDDTMNESTESPPHTVRERSPGKKEERSLDKMEERSLDNEQDVDNTANKSTENIANIIESSIYCARVKELRKRIVTEVNAIIGTLDSHAMVQLEPAEIRRMTKRSAEFCGRFQRIHLYQLHRQMYDIKRHNASAMPFAKYTQFQSQMVRVVSLHQNMLQSFQVFHKCQSGSLCLRDSISQVLALSEASKEATRLCREVVLVTNCSVQSLYDDNLEHTCEKLDESLKLYEERIAEFICPIESSRSSTRRSVRSKTSDANKNKGVKKRVGPWVKPSKSSADSRLSMYSLDTLRLNLASCPSSKEPASSSTSRVRNVASPPLKLNVDLKSAVAATKQNKKSPTSRRPLMRDPQRGKPRRARVKDSEIKTMVEVVEAPSSHISINNNTPRAELTNLYHSMKAPLLKQSPRGRATRMPTNSVVCDSDRRNKQEQSPKEKYFINEVPVEATLKVDNYCPPKLEDIEKEDFPLEEQISPKRRTKKENVQCSKKNESPRNVNPQTGCEVTRLLRQLCGNTAGSKNERTTGAKNAQLVNINGSSPRQPSTPQLLKILEETIQKKAPRPMYPTPKFQDEERFRLPFNIPDETCDHLLKYRTKFVQYMLSSSMYANGAVGKPWEVIDSISSEIVDEILEQLASEMELSDVLKQMLRCETSGV